MTSVVQQQDSVFHRDLTKQYPIITHGKGIYLFDETGKKYLDGSSGAVAANLGHSVSEIVNKITEQASKVGFVHTLRFETEVLHELSNRICYLAPEGFSKVFYTCSGSEANESAIKLAVQYHRDRGESKKSLVIGRWQSYHGNTLGALSVGGDVKRRKSFSNLTLPFPHVESPHFKNDTFNEKDKDLTLDYINEIERTIEEYGAENIAALICEPIVGSQQGAIVPPKQYLVQIKQLCEKNNILFIADEVMTGFGRTGKNFAIEHFDIIPDIITFGKGVTGGYLPLGGMIVQNEIINSLIEYSNGKFAHGFTYSGHPVLAAAGLAALQYYESQKVLENCTKQGEYLVGKLQNLYEKHTLIGSINGKGLLIGLELVPDRNGDSDFLASANISERLNELAMERGLVLYPGSGAKRGEEGQHIIIAPPLIIKEDEIDEIISILDDVLTTLAKELV